MMTLVCGGASSGKSRYAEALAASYGKETACVIYLATMRRDGNEASLRIAKHRSLREHLGFVTVEKPLGIGETVVQKDSVVLLEDIGNLCANEMFYGEFQNGGSIRGTVREDDVTGRIANAIAKDLSALASRCRHLIAVTQEAGAGGTDYGDETLAYLKLLGKTNRLLAKTADYVCEVVSGIPVFHKGGRRQVRLDVPNRYGGSLFVAD